jgi:hypothetical protein
MFTTARRVRQPVASDLTPSRARSERAAVQPKPRAALDTFLQEGVVAEIDQWGVERFNFPQDIWLYPDVAMGSVGTTASEVLAVNILTRLINVRDVPVLVGLTTRRALQLAPRFVEECLPSRDPRCRRYTIPIAALRDWLKRRR